MEALLGGPVGAAVGQGGFPATKAGLLDIYAAHCLLPGERPEQREKALLSSRTLHFLQGLNRDSALLGDRRRLGRILRARVVLPSEFLQKKATSERSGALQTSVTTAAVVPTASTAPPYFSSGNFERLKGLYAIKNELRAAKRRNLQELTVRRYAAPPRARVTPPPAPGGDSGREGTPQPGEPMVSASTSALRSRILLPAVVQSISRPTMDFLTKEGISTDRLDVDEGLRAVGGKIRGLRKLFLQGVPTSAMVAVDRLVALGDMVQDAPPGLLDGAVSPGLVGTTPSSGVGPVQPLGIGDLLIVEQTLQNYVAGEISYVENVLKTESFKRSFRSLNRTEQTVFTSTTTTEESERDLQSTDRYELSTQAQKTIVQDMSVQAGMTVSGSYGPVSVGAYGDFATSTSTTESTSSAVTFAQDVTERSVSTIITEVREEQTTRILQESEEKSEHGFDNTSGAANVTGIYQWLDKEYQAQIYNYGKRLMFDFKIPGTSEFYRYALANQPMTGVSLTEPDPLGGLQPSDLTEDNYQDYLSMYAVSGASVPPPETTVIGTVFEQSGLDQNTLVTKSTTSLQIPAGYRAKYGRFNSFHAFFNNGHYLKVIIGTHEMDSSGFQNVNVAMEDEDTTIPVGVIGYLWGLLVTIEVECERTEAAYQEWQQNTYDSIVAAYNAQKSAYDSQVSSAGFTANSTTHGGSEAENRRIEQEELKKGSLTLLARQYFENFDAMHLTNTASGLPEFDVDEAMDEGSYAQFFEQAFEWGQMTYLLYSYFWMNKTGWLERFNLQSSDALFAEFLRAGYARVVVPVTPAYNDAVLYYLSSAGEIWNGGDPPTIDDPLYIAIADELDDDTEGRVAVGDPWKVTIPTTLVYLKADGTLPDWTTNGS